MKTKARIRKKDETGDADVATFATFATSTLIVPLLDVGTYWGPYRYEDLWGEEEKDIRDSGGIVCGDYNYRKLGEALCEDATAVFRAEKVLANDGVLDIRAVDFHSPREYNFSEDWLSLEFDVSGDFFDRAEKRIFDPRYRETFEKYISDHWVSRDGFISFMDVSALDDMWETIRFLREIPARFTDSERYFGSVAALLLVAAVMDGRLTGEEDEFSLTLSGKLFTRFTERHSLDEFCTVLNGDDVRRLYPVASSLLTRSESKRKKLSEDLAKYALCGVPPEAVDKATVEMDGKRKWLDGFENDVRETVAGNHPDPYAVERGLREMEDVWKTEWE